MDFKINLKKLMKEQDLTFYRLNKICDLSINTIRSLTKKTNKNPNLNSLAILAQVLDCSIKDLIEDDPVILNYDKIAQENKDVPLYSRNQVFSPDNNEYLRQLLLQVGAACHISSYSRYRTAYVKSEYYLSSIQIDLNLRVVEAQGKPTLEVINFYVCVNQRLQSEAVIKDAIIKVLEIYARKLNISEISFIISQSLEKETAFILNANSELPADFSYTLGTASVLFTQNNYKRSPSHYFQEFQTIWHKALG